MCKYSGPKGNMLIFSILIVITIAFKYELFSVGHAVG